MALNAEQWKFIAARLLASTDKEAAERVGLVPHTVADWKRHNPEFTAQYEASFTDGVEVAKAYTRKMLGKAAQRLDEALDATTTVAVSVVGEDEKAAITIPDHKSRLKAIELAFRTHGLLRDRIEWKPDLSGMTDEELAQLERLTGKLTGNS